MILSIRGVMIPIYLVSSVMDSIRWSIVLFKPVMVLTSDPKSEFLCQSSLSCTEPTDPLNTSYTWDISHALDITYHPYCHSPGALTEYLKQKLRHQRAKHLGRSLPAQVEQDVPLKGNIGASTSMALGVFRSVRTLATIFRVVSVWFLVFKQVGGSEIQPQCHLYNQMAFKQ